MRARETIFTSQGLQLYQDMMLYIQRKTEAVGEGHQLSIDEPLEIILHFIEDFKRSNDLLETAMSYYDPRDIAVSHAVNVTVFSLKMALDMSLSKEEVEDTVLAALFHDVGFGMVPAFHKEKEVIPLYESDVGLNNLSAKDQQLVLKHPQFGYEAIAHENNRAKRIAEIILQHHEKADGSGYPHGLKESEQLLQAKIISIVDTYDNLIHPRPFRDALAPPQGIETIIKQQGRTFSREMIKQLLKSLSVFPLGHFVRLSNRSVGKVIRANSDNPLRPDVELQVDSSGHDMQTPKVVKLQEEYLLSIVECLPLFKEKG